MFGTTRRFLSIARVYVSLRISLIDLRCMDDIVIRSRTLISWKNKKFQSITRNRDRSRINEIESRHTSRNWDGGRYRCAWAFEVGNIAVSVYKISPTELAVVIHGQSHSDNCYQPWFRDKPNLEFSRNSGIFWGAAYDSHGNYDCTVQYSDSDICYSFHRLS